MKRLSLFVAIGCFTAAWMAAAANAETLEETIQHMLNPQTFNVSVIDDDATLIVTSGASRRVYDHDDVAALAANIKTGGAKSEISDFKVLNKTEVGQFASITYEANWKSTLGQTITTTHLTSHEVWERQPSGWRRLFAAMEH